MADSFVFSENRFIPRLLFLLLLLGVYYLFDAYFDAESKKENDIVQLQQLLAPVAAELKPTDWVVFLSNNESVEFRYKLQFVLSPVRLRIPAKEHDYSSGSLLYVYDHRAGPAPATIEERSMVGKKVFSTNDTTFSVTLLKPL